ncbi:ARID/BRIGHT DNA binding domain protein [Opisthorchis viverrini]|uniref:ARID/BRIGHT DNA binding domain protein n=1 Tax=Opisthorchis viverrini TaxID=6198 RepID=A0A1S8X7Q2_OPIVI|nr:ARID/BRIGHT DNA binding domain protein [Opisthorchis viverrini]
MNTPNPRYPDPYGRTAYPGYPPSSAYPYYQTPTQQLRQQPLSQTSASEYPISNAAAPSKVPSTPPTSGPSLMDRPSSRSMNIHGQNPAISPSSQLSSPVHAGGNSGNPPSSNWPPQGRPFGSPQQLNHGQSPFQQQPQQQQQPRPRSASRDTQPMKVSSEPSSEPSTIAQADCTNECATAQAEDEAGSRPPSRLSEAGRPPTANSSGSGIREHVEEQMLPNATDLLPVTSDSLSSGPSVSMDSSSPHPGPPHFSNISSPNSSPNVSRGTPQSYPSFSQQPAFNTSASVPAQAAQSVGGPPAMNVSGLQRLPGQVGPPSRPYGIPSQNPPVSRHPYPPYMQGQPTQQPTTNNYLAGGRGPAFYPGGTHPMRHVTSPMHSLGVTAGGPPRSAGPPGQFLPQTGPGGPGMMPPPAAPPPAVSQIGAATSGPTSQPGFLPGAYNLSATTNGTPYPAPMVPATSSWDQQSQHPGLSNNVGSQQQFATGRPSPLYTGPADRVVGYPPSPQHGGATSSNSTGSIPQLSGGPYPHAQLPVSYHSQLPYPSSQPPYPSHPYPSGMGLNGPAQLSQQPLSGSNAPAYPSGLPTPAGGPAGQPIREHFHPQYAPGLPQPSDRGPPSCGPLSAPGISPESGPTAVRMVAGGIKMLPGGVIGKGPKIEPGVRVVTPTLAAGSSPSQPGPSPITGGSEESTHTQNAVQQQTQSSGIIQHPHQPPMQAYASGYWSEGPAPNQFNPSMVGPHGPHSYSPFQSQPPYRSTMPPQLPSHHMHNFSGSTGGPPVGSPMYGGTMAPQNTPHVHSTAHVSSQSSSGFQKLLEMGSEPERRPWLEHYVRFMDEIGKPLVGLPQVVKQPLDLYRFYLAVRERGGVLEVIKARRWKEISQLVNINASASAAYTLRKNYCKFLLDYECRFDQGGTDPRPILQLIDGMSGKKKKQASGDNENGCASGTSLSASGLQVPAPPSPAGSHSSASSSLLPPGSGSASLSGVPTAGSAASDSQLGPPTQNRLSESSQSVGNLMIGEGTNGLSSSPSSTVMSSGTSFAPGTNIPSPQRPSSATATVNGYMNTPHNSAETTVRSGANWPWSSESDSTASVAHQHPGMSINGFPTSPSVRSSVSHSMPTAMDGVARFQYAMTPSPLTKVTSPHQLPPGTSSGPGHPTSASSIAGSVPATTTVSPSIAAPLTAPSSNVSTMFQRMNEPTVHHHSGPYPPPGPHCLPGMQPHSALSQHPPSPGHPGIQQCNATGTPQSVMHPRMGMPLNVRPSPFGPSVAPHPAGAGDPVAILRMHQFRSSTPNQLPSYPPGLVPPYPGGPPPVGHNVPAHLIHHHGQRPGYVATILKRVEHYPFPPGSIEATQVEPTRRRRYRTKDVGQIASFKLLMALRSGLTAEVSWALNCLNIILRDEVAPDLIVPSTLPTLITNLVELWRHSLGELFDHDLFVTSLELPTDLGMVFRPGFSRSLIDKHVSKAGQKATPKRLQKTELSRVPNISTASNGLAILERDIIALAMSYNVPVSTVRNRIRNLLRKCADSSSNSVSLRTRNGLLFRVEQLASIPNSLGANISTGDQNATHGSRTRKRGKQTLTGLNCISATSSTLVNCSAALPSISSSSAFSSATVKPEPMGTWTTARVTVAANSLKTPEAYVNLRELALFAIDELVENELRSPVVHGTSLKTDTDARKAFAKVHPPLPERDCNSKLPDYLRQLMTHGGGDTTCHIMPPFGAFPFQSDHWSAEPVTIDTKLPHLLIRSTEDSSTPPPVVLKEKCAPGDESVGGHEEAIDLIDEDDSQPLTKRVRHASTSSLACPVLSPQPIEDLAEDSQSKETRALSTANAAVEHPSPSDRLHMHEDSEFTQLVMDASGRCPLRAREELVHHGLTCLWSDDNETDSNEARAVRCLCVSTVLRNLSFFSQAEHHLSSHKGILSLIGRVILLGHDHVGPTDTWHSVEVAARSMEASQCAWRTPTWLEDMRENALVLLVNIAGYLDLIRFEESIVRPILEGVIHWIICPTAVAADPFPGHRTLSPRRLALEAVNRLCVHESNVDLLLSTPGSKEAELTKLFDRLANWLSLPEDQVTRELALSTMHYLTGGGVSFGSSADTIPSKSSAGDPSSISPLPNNYTGTTLLALAKPCPIAGLLAFIEAAEATTRRVIDQFGVQALQERPELMGTSLEMVRRAGALLDRLATDSTGRSRFTPNLELRLLDLVTSRVLDATVAHLLCGALHRLSPKRQLEDKVLSPIVPPNPSPTVVSQLLKNSVSGIRHDVEQCTEDENQLVGVKSEEKVDSDVATLISSRENGPCRMTTDSVETLKDEVKIVERTNIVSDMCEAQTKRDKEYCANEPTADDSDPVLYKKITDVSSDPTGDSQASTALPHTSVSVSGNCLDP